MSKNTFLQNLQVVQKPQLLRPFLTGAFAQIAQCPPHPRVRIGKASCERSEQREREGKASSGSIGTAYVRCEIASKASSEEGGDASPFGIKYET